MAKSKGMSRIQNRDDDTSRRKRVKNRDNSCVSPWSGLNNDVLFLVMMKLGVIDFVAFSGVCKSWRSFALCNRKRFMASRPPMMMRISNRAYKKECYLEDFEGRKFKTLLPRSGGRSYMGSTCGFLVFYGKKTKDFWLVNPITRHQLHFTDFPGSSISGQIKAILVSSPSIPEWMLVVIDRRNYKLWFSIAGKGAWNDVSSNYPILDIVAFKGKIYSINSGGILYEMSPGPNPKVSMLDIKNSGMQYSYNQEFVSLGENLYVISTCINHPRILYELDFGEMKWLSREEKSMGEYAFFLSDRMNCVAIKPESWAVDPRSNYKSYDCFNDTNDETQKGRFFSATHSWYFSHCCVDVDLINV